MKMSVFSLTGWIVAGGAVTLLTLMAKFADDKCAQLEE